MPLKKVGMPISFLVVGKTWCLTWWLELKQTSWAMRRKACDHSTWKASRFLATVLMTCPIPPRSKVLTSEQSRSEFPQTSHEPTEGKFHYYVTALCRLPQPPGKPNFEILPLEAPNTFCSENQYCWYKQENIKEAGISLVTFRRSLSPLRKEMWHSYSQILTPEGLMDLLLMCTDIFLPLH